MFLVRGQKAELIKHNRNGRSLAYDDEDKTFENIEVIPYNVDNEVSFGTYTEPNAVGYFIVRRHLDIKEGDEIRWNTRTYSVTRIAEKWLYNRLEYKVAHVK